MNDEDRGADRAEGHERDGVTYRKELRMDRGDDEFELFDGEGVWYGYEPPQSIRELLRGERFAVSLIGDVIILLSSIPNLVS